MLAALTSKPTTFQPSSNSARAMALPIPELVPVTTARRSFGTDLSIGDDLRRACHVILLEAREVLDRTRREQQALRDELVSHIGRQRLVDLRIQTLRDVARQFCRAPQAIPAVKFVPRNGLPDSGHIRHAGHPGLGRYGNDLQLPCLGERSGSQ